MSGITLISTVRAPEEQVRRFVEHHHNLGIDEIMLFYDDPEMAFEYGDTRFVCDGKYWGIRPSSIEQRQIRNVNYARIFARGDWLIHLDCDELIQGPIKTEDVDVLRFTQLEAVPEKMKYESIFEPRLFRRNVSQWRRWLASKFCPNAFYNGEYFRGYTLPKCIMRKSVGRIGNHGPVDFTGLRVKQSAIPLAHYDCVGFEDWQRKWEWRLDRSGYATELRDARLQQMQAYYIAKTLGHLEELYQRLYFIPARERRILSVMGMLVRL